MKRIQYISRFARPLSNEEIEELAQKSEDYNARIGITGFLLCLGDIFFQVIEGEDAAVDELYYERICKDPRHKEILCLKLENDVTQRNYGEWTMNVHNLNKPDHKVPLAFQSTINTLLESYRILSAYTQSSIRGWMQRGIDPTSIDVQLKSRVVLVCDIVGFSELVQRLAPVDVVTLVNTYVGLCDEAITGAGGVVNKLLGDGLMAYFDESEVDATLKAALGILEALEDLRNTSPEGAPARKLQTGIGITLGEVVEGNMGSQAKRDYTIIGSAVNLAARLEALTRDLGTPLAVAPEIRQASSHPWNWRSLGRHSIKGYDEGLEVFTIEH
jgi:adenylate cyclase